MPNKNRVAITRDTNELIELMSGAGDLDSLRKNAEDAKIEVNGVLQKRYPSDNIHVFETDLTEKEVLKKYETKIDKNKREKLEAKKAKKRSEIEKAFPSWEQVNVEINNIENIADVKAFSRKLARVVYWSVKNQEY